MAELIRKPSGELDSCIPNVISILANDSDWRGVIGLDTFAGEPVWLDPPPWLAHDAPAEMRPKILDSDDARLVAWLHRRYSIRISTGVARDCLQVAAESHPFHPVKEYLHHLQWDGTERLPTMAHIYFGADADVPHYQSAAMRWMIAAVKRIMEPGCQCDSLLVLEGIQGLGKSRALRTLASDDWFADEIGDPASKDAADALRGKWIIEIGELRWRKSDEETRKAFISRRVDHYRPAYGRRTIDVPRQCILAASTNESAWQTDPTGARRYWVVLCRRIDASSLARDRDQLWAEAFVRYDRGEASFLTDRETYAQRSALDQRRETDPWDDAVAKYLLTVEEVSIPQILSQAIGLETARQGRSESMRVSRILTACGWAQRGYMRVAGRKSRRYIREAP
jgi:putative DNA primase/helicase